MEGLLKKLLRLFFSKPLLSVVLPFPFATSCGGFFSSGGIQLHHLIPESILHIAIFIQLCEAFLGIHPHFDLFKSLFSLNPCPNLRNIARIGGADL